MKLTAATDRAGLAEEQVALRPVATFDAARQSPQQTPFHGGIA